MIGAGDAWPLSINIAADDQEKLLYVNMWGVIEAGDDQKFRSMILPYLKTGYVVFQVNIFSNGGNVRVAMDLGKQIRTLQARTETASNKAVIIDNQFTPTGTATCGFWEGKGGYTFYKPVEGYDWCTCESACFLIWASGVTRGGGRIGVHRFYYKGSEFGNLPAHQARELYRNAEADFRAYLGELNVPASIIDRLFATSSRAMHYLTWPEIQLISSTPYLEEMVYSKCGQSRHVPMSAANNWTSTEDPMHVACYRTILKEIMSEGVKSYLAALGETTSGVGGPFVPVPVKPTAEKYWNHNGSSLRLETDKARRRFIYIEPREGLREVGVTGGMVAFDGKRVANTYEGTAYVFSRRCGPIGYVVKGSVSSDERSVTMRGFAPYVNTNCEMSGGRDSTLMFELVEN